MERKLKWCKALHRITVIICLLSVSLPVLLWKHIPEQIPSHFGAGGRADAWSDKSFMILVIFFAVLMLGIMSITEYYVRSSGMSSYATKEEKGSLRYIYPMIVIMNFTLQLMISYLIFCAAAARDMGGWFLPAVLLTIFGPMLYFIPKSMKRSSLSKEQSAFYRKREKESEGTVYRSKVDWWLGLLLIGCIVTPLWIFIDELVKEGDFDWILLITEIFIAALLIPLLRMKYILYPDYLLVICIGKERIPYRQITGIKETHNPLSSAALSLNRLQIDYRNDKGGHNMILISPTRKEEFVERLRKEMFYKEEYQDERLH